MDAIVKNPYFKLSTNNITSFIFEEFYLKKTENNIKANTSFFCYLIKKVFDIKKVNTANSNKNISITTYLITKSLKNCYS